MNGKLSVQDNGSYSLNLDKLIKRMSFIIQVNICKGQIRLILELNYMGIQNEHINLTMFMGISFNLG